MHNYFTKTENPDNIDGPCVISQITNNEALSKKGVHVFYAFYEKEKYIHNAANFIIEGMDKGHKILLLEKAEVYEAIIARIISKGYKQNDIESIIFVDNDQFYLLDDKFDVETSIQNLERNLKSFIDKGLVIRVWGQVSFQVNEPVLSKLKLYECECDHISDHNKLVVCTYNGLSVPSYIQNEMLKTHQYFMTDDQIRLSPFYDKNLNILSSGELERLHKLDKEIVLLQNKNKELQKINNEIKMNKAVIEESEKFYRNLINELPISILITKEDHIVYLNNTGILKLDHQSILGKEFSRLFEKTSTTSANGLSEYKFLLDENDVKYFDVKSIPIWFEGECAVLHVLIDLTEQKVNEKLMIRSEKLSIAGELAAGIAHEIRNPLTAIKGFIQLLENTNDKYYLSIINDELTRIEQISSELLMLAKPHLETFKTTDIIMLLRNVKILLGTQAIIKNIDIILITEETELYIDCEETKIRQVFVNIIKNAIEVMDKGSIWIRVNKMKDKVHVDIVDQGEGISQEMLDKIGEPFYTTKEKGTGLGLMVCYKIVRNHNGEIHVKSQKGTGTTFTVILPLSTVMYS